MNFIVQVYWRLNEQHRKIWFSSARWDIFGNSSIGNRSWDYQLNSGGSYLLARQSACLQCALTQPTEAGKYTSPLIPSVLAQLPDHTVWIGEGVKRLRTFPQNANLFSEKNLFCDTKNDGSWGQSCELTWPTC